MTSKEIRTMFLDPTYTSREDHNAKLSASNVRYPRPTAPAELYVQAEIAAQLAELNEKFQKVIDLMLEEPKVYAENTPQS